MLHSDSAIEWVAGSACSTVRGVELDAFRTTSRQLIGRGECCANRRAEWWGT